MHILRSLKKNAFINAPPACDFLEPLRVNSKNTFYEY